LPRITTLAAAWSALSTFAAFPALAEDAPDNSIVVTAFRAPVSQDRNDRESARAILTYATRHAASEEGVVRYADWPEGVKGHFIVRTPPEGYLCT